MFVTLLSSTCFGPWHAHPQEGQLQKHQSALNRCSVQPLLWERGYQMLCLCSCSSWRWTCQGPKHVEDKNVTYILLLNCALKLVEEIILYYDARSIKHQTTLPWLNTADRNTGQIWATYSVTYLYIHIIQGHYFIHPVPLLTLCRYFNVCVRSGQSPATISVPLTVQHSQHTVYYSLSLQFNSHLFCFYVSF